MDIDLLFKPSRGEGDALKNLQNEIEKLTENQSIIVAKFENLLERLEEYGRIVIDCKEKLRSVEETNGERKRLKAEVKLLRDRIDELYTVVKEMKEGEVNSNGDGVDDAKSDFSNSSKVAMTTGIDRDTIREAYEDVRSDSTPTDWAVFKFEGARIVCSARGSDLEQFRSQFADEERAFGYLRLQMGDEMSKRRKFLLVTWVGPRVSVINRAKMSTDKAIIKDIISNFAVELQLESQSEIDIDQFKEILNRAGGANYGTGVREL